MSECCVAGMMAGSDQVYLLGPFIGPSRVNFSLFLQNLGQIQFRKWRILDER